MFHVLSNVQSGEATNLLRPIDNRQGVKLVALRSIHCWVGWYNVKELETCRWRSAPNDIKGIAIQPGLYNFGQLKRQMAIAGAAIEVDSTTGLASITIPNGIQVHLSAGLVTLLGLEAAEWINSGTTIGARPVNFNVANALYIHLDQVSTNENFVDGTPSALIGVISIPDSAFGSEFTVSIAQPEYRRLQAGTISELKVRVCDEHGRTVDNHELPISVTLEVRDEYLRT